MRALLGAVGATAALVAAALVVLRRRLVIVQVHGVSMEPTLRDGQRVLVRRTGLDGVEPGQVVVFASLAGTGGAAIPGEPPWMIKRAVALPGDPVPVHLVPPSTAGVDGRVPPGRLVVLGDNRSASFDSRRAGYVEGCTLLGVVVDRWRLACRGCQ